MATYPYQVIRTRLQHGLSIFHAKKTNILHQTSETCCQNVFKSMKKFSLPHVETDAKNMRSVISYIGRKQSLSGFYRGLPTNLIRILPSTCLTFVVYEQLLSILNQQQKTMD